MNAPHPAEATAAVMARAAATFQAILEILHSQTQQAGLLTASYVIAAGAAADGRDAVVSAPAVSQVTPGPLPELPVPGPDAGAEAIADAVAEVAGRLAEQLATAAPAAGDPQDRQALRSALLAARRVHDYLAGTG
jgi:hypothetical protein